MTERLHLLSTPAEVAEALADAAAWSTEFDLCTPAIDSRLGQWPLWRGLFNGEQRVRRAFVAVDGLRSEPHALEELHRRGALRLVPAADGSFRTHLLRFRRHDRLRILTGSGALVPDGVMAPLEAMTCWDGPEYGAFALQVERLIARARQLSHVPEPEELQNYASLYFDACSHRDSLSEIGAPLIRRTAFDGELHDLEVVDDGAEVRRAMKVAREQIISAASRTTRETLGYRGGNFEANVRWSSSLGMWAFFHRADADYWNYFGVDRPASSSSLPITVQVNVPLDGVDRKRGGAIAREPGTGKKFLVHRGRIGGGQKGVGTELFWNRFRGGVHMREPDRGIPSRVVIVGELGAVSFPRDVAAFVHEVARIKRAVA